MRSGSFIYAFIHFQPLFIWKMHIQFNAKVSFLLDVSNQCKACGYCTIPAGLNSKRRKGGVQTRPRLSCISPAQVQPAVLVIVHIPSSSPLLLPGSPLLNAPSVPPATWRKLLWNSVSTCTYSCFKHSSWGDLRHSVFSLLSTFTWQDLMQVGWIEAFRGRLQSPLGTALTLTGSRWS